MKVLFLCPWEPWPLTNGGKTRTYHLLREAAKHAEIHVHLVREPGTSSDTEAALRDHVASLEIHDRTSPGPTRRWSRAKIERWFHSQSLTRALTRDLGRGEFDVVHLDEMLLARLVPRNPGAAVVVHHHKLDTVLYEALEADNGPHKHFDLWKLRRLEKYATTRFRHHLLCSDDDAAILRERHGDLNFGVIPSGYDEAHFPTCAPPCGRDPKRILFLGSMDYGPNVDGARWFVRECLPRLRERRPALRLDIVGRNPVPEVHALAGDGVTVVGAVPEVTSHLERCGVFVVPLRIGGGTRLKLVEALAVGCPTVSTAIGAEGLGLRDGEHLLLADDAAGQAQAVEQLLDDRTRAATMGERGYQFVHSRYRWASLGKQLVDYWESAAASS